MLFFTGCEPQEGGEVGLPLKPEEYPKLATSLFELATAKEPEKYAQRAGLAIEDGLVQVVIEAEGSEWLEDLKWAVEALGGQFELSAENLVQARVPIGALLKLARHPRVLYIRPPVRPQRGG